MLRNLVAPRSLGKVDGSFWNLGFVFGLVAFVRLEKLTKTLNRESDGRRDPFLIGVAQPPMQAVAAKPPWEIAAVRSLPA